jgi:hypothetical protein
MLKRFGTQIVEIDDKEGFMTTALDEPFYTAGKILGWKGNSVGIGIAKEIVEYGACRWFSIVVIVNNRKYVYDAEDWKKVCEENKWLYTVSNDKTLYVLPWSYMRRVI